LHFLPRVYTWKNIFEQTNIQDWTPIFPEIKAILATQPVTCVGVSLFHSLSVPSHIFPLTHTRGAATSGFHLPALHVSNGYVFSSRPLPTQTWICGKSTHTRRHIRTLNFQFRLPRQAPRFPHFLPAPFPFPFSRENEFRFVCWNIFSVFGGTIYWLMWPKFAGLFGDWLAPYCWRVGETLWKSVGHNSLSS